MRIWLVVANGNDSPRWREREKPGETEITALATQMGRTEQGVKWQAAFFACFSQQQEGDVPHLYESPRGSWGAGSAGWGRRGLRWCRWAQSGRRRTAQRPLPREREPVGAGKLRLFSCFYFRSLPKIKRAWLTALEDGSPLFIHKVGITEAANSLPRVHLPVRFNTDS